MTHLERRYDLLIWDWNGTLLDDVETCVAVMNDCLGRRNLPLLTRDRYCEIFEFPVINYYRRLPFDFQRETFEQVGGEFLRGYEQRMFQCALHEGALDVLGAARQRGIRQFILSALFEDYLLKILDFFRLREYFPQVFGLADRFAEGKTELGREMLAKTGVDPARALMIGDTLHDHEVARAMGVDCVLVGKGHNAPARLAATGVRVIAHHRELLELLG